MLPTFLVIGTAKASTTSLYHYLRQHPQVFMPAKKEMHFFSSRPHPLGQHVVDPPVDPDDSHRHIVDAAEYEAFFDSADGKAAVGEASPTYIYFSAAAHNIKQTIPQAKIIALLRNPADRAYSAWSHLVRDEAEPLSFEEALEQEPDRIAQGAPSFYHYRAWGYYHEQLKLYYELFDREQIRVYLQSDLTRDPDRVFPDLFSFLGVDESFRPDTSVVHNLSGLPKNRAWHKFLTEAIHRNPVVNVLKRPIPQDTYRRWVTTLKNRNLVKTTMAPATRAALLEGYRDDIAACEALLGRSLQHWLR